MFLDGISRGIFGVAAPLIRVPHILKLQQYDEIPNQPIVGIEWRMGANHEFGFTCKLLRS